MKKLFISGALALLLAACAPAPSTMVCDREAQPYDKFGTTEDLCYVESQTSSTRMVHDDDADDRGDQRPPRHDRPDDGYDGGSGDDQPDGPSGPPDSDPESPVNDKPKGKDRPKGNASANNGKGGNYDKTGHSDNGKGQGRNNPKKGDY